MKLNHIIRILCGLVFLGNATLFSGTPIDAAQPKTPPQLQSEELPNASVRSSDPAADDSGGVRLAQDYFHSVKKTTASPFSRPVDPAVPDVKTIGTTLKAFGVPFNINADDDSFVEVQLYLSRDMGKTWTFYARQNTDRTDFPFQADGDGEYWFALKTLNRDRRLVPDGDPQAELKIVVDTVKPELDFRIETDAAGRVACRWNARDENLMPESFRMMYQPVNKMGTVGDWQQVPVELNGKSRAGIYADQVAWWPETAERQLNVAIEIRDLGGNVTQVQRQVVVPPSAWRHSAVSVAQITDANRSLQKSPNQLASDEPAKRPGPPLPKAATTPAQTAAHSANQPQAEHPNNVICEGGVCRVVSTKLVGSDVENVDPPIPSGYTASKQDSSDPPVQNNVGRQSGAIVWQSEPQQRLSRNRSTVGTTVGSTRGPDPSLAPPINPTQKVSKPVTDVPSNPAFTTGIGDQVVSESSTMGATNQYRGLSSQGTTAIPAPTLLPDLPTHQENAVANQQTGHQYPDTGHPGYETIASTNRHARQGSGGFAVAGYRNRETAFQAESDPGRATKARDSRAAEQVIGSKRFRLDYGIDAIDPSGVARVDLWMTPDGRNWNSWGSDPDNQSPFPVEVENDGRYGFRIVVHSKDGLTGQGPSTGDAADLWVLIDSQSPLVRITSVPYGRETEAGKLVINYSVSDDHLTLRPITLAYSATSQGPWNLIGEGFRNEGRHVWKPTTDVPEHIYLRIEALDKAGNVGVHVLSQAIDVSGLVPRGTIRGVSPVGR